jgi:hypothetical protein
MDFGEEVGWALGIYYLKMNPKQEDILAEANISAPPNHNFTSTSIGGRGAEGWTICCWGSGRKGRTATEKGKF